jgi:L-threonylcarbamoyladenylate synthase
MFATQVGRDINKAASFLSEGQPVAIPTETVYGLAANALNPDAVIKIYEVKNRPSFNPLIVHTHSIAEVQKMVTHITPEAMQLMQAFWPGPISFLLPRNSSIIPDIVCAGLPQMAVRIPNNNITLDLLKRLPFPLCAPSANTFGYVSPTTAQHVLHGLQGSIPYILDDGPCHIGIESTIIECLKDKIIMHRQGGITEQAIASITSLPIIKELALNKKPTTSGQLKSHYATHTPLILDHIENNIKRYPNKKIAVISLSKKYEQVDSFTLSADNNLSEAAKNIFALLRQLDGNYDVILAERMPNHGLGIAINDRLHRAQHSMKDL